MTHDIFISYSREDSDTMHKVEQALLGAGFTIWTDRGIHPGSPSWKTDIEKAIQDAGCMVVLFSPDSAESRWVRAELDYADAQHKSIYPLLVRGDVTNAVPFGFTGYQRIDLRDSRRLASGLEQLITALKSGDASASATPIHTSTPKPVKSRLTIRGLLPLAVVLIALIGIAGVLFVNGSRQLTVTPTQANTGAYVPTPLPTMPPFTMPAGFKRLEGERTLMAVPSIWSSDIDPDILINSLMVYAPDDEQTLEFIQNMVDGLDIFAVDMLRFQVTGVSIEDAGFPVSYAILEERIRTLYTAFDSGGTFTNHGLVETPAGSMLFSDGITMNDTGLVLNYTLIRRSLIYSIFITGRISDREALVQLGNTISQSFRVKE